MIDLFEQHIERVEDMLLRGYLLERAADWIVEKTFLKREPYTFLDHEFQERIARDMAIEVVVRKCSQIGLSELSARLALAFCNTMPAFTTIYTLPTAHFAKTFAKTRFDPIIESSPDLAKRVNKELNSGEVKQFLDSFLYIKGTIGTTAAISVPADALFHDELDFSDDETVSNYESRLTHSKYKMKRKFSTPTVSGVGITKEFDTSRRHHLFVHCSHCAERFLPDYFKHVKIPGYDGDLRAISADNLWKVRWREAYLACPGCGKAPDLGPARREWVVENTDYTGDKHGYQISPFDAPKIVTASDLVRASTKYARFADFVNFNLGQPCEDLETSFSKEELLALFEPRPDTEKFEPYAHVMGIDVGLMCHIAVAGVGPEGKLDIVHLEKVPHTQLEARKVELQLQYRVRVTVMDSQPYYDLLVRLQGRDQNLWGAVFTATKGIEAIRPTDKEKDSETGQEKVRQVSLSRNQVLDLFMAFVRAHGLAARGQAAQLRDVFVEHLQDMKRVKQFNHDDELSFAWKKSASGNDHFHFTTMYAFVASRLLGTVSSVIILPFGMRTMAIKETVDARGKPTGDRVL